MILKNGDGNPPCVKSVKQAGPNNGDPSAGLIELNSSEYDLRCLSNTNLEDHSYDVLVHSISTAVVDLMSKEIR